MRAHHRRRLTKLGWEHALEPTGDLWCQGEPPPRPGNAIEILVDGAEVIPRLLEALRQARSHVHYAGWYLDPDFRLTREESPLIVRDFFAELAEEVDVRVLL